jgi:hypothetical protein
MNYPNNISYYEFINLSTLFVDDSGFSIFATDTFNLITLWDRVKKERTSLLRCQSKNHLFSFGCLH